MTRFTFLSSACSRFRCGSAILIIWCSLSTSYAQLPLDCFDFTIGHGPFDYRTVSVKDKRLVEGIHFTPGVESLRTRSAGSLGGDIGYTLRAFPNHPRALQSMMKLAERDKTDMPRGARFSLACYFARALRFAPDDGSVRVLFGVYLLRRGQKAEAVEQLVAAQELAGNDPNLHYNLGLAYFDLEDYEKSLVHARKAYELGFPLPGLRNKLKAAGKWRD